MSLSSFISTLGWATQPSAPRVKFEFELRGSAATVRLENQEKYPVVLAFHPGELGTIGFERFQASLAPQQRAEINLEKVAARRGRQILHVESTATIKNEFNIAGPSLYQPYLISDQGSQKLTYEEAFLRNRERVEGNSELAKIDLGGALDVSEINRLAFKADVVPSTAQITPFIYRGALDYTKMGVKQLPKDSQVIGGRAHSSSFEEELFEPESLSPFAQVIKGKMSLKINSNTYQAAWGWVVRAWQKVGGNWVFLGWTYVGGDGSWQIGLSNVASGVPVRIEYRTKNRFVSIQDPSGNPYTWGDNWNLGGAITDIGSRYADLTVNGDLPAVDRLYVGSTQIWVKFFNNGMNALRDKPIEVTFPNALASGKCVYDTGSGPYAWSCSYWGDGKIYIIPAHGSASVVQHEIAHSINSFYWDGNLPPGSGGAHNLWDCYNNGLALTEGFANFLTYWTQFDRGQLAPVAPYFNMNIESIPAGVCANQTAEMRVASTFWDMYDTRNDSLNANASDGLNYVSQAVPVSIYLGNKKNSMAEYLPVVKAGQTAFWQEQFTKLFRLGYIVP
jgi:hypothetical protein